MNLLVLRLAYYQVKTNDSTQILICEVYKRKI